MTLVDTIYINSGGGKILLDYLLKEILNTQKNTNFFLLLDKRNKVDETILSKFDYKILAPGIIERHFFYKKNIYRFNKVFCFGNVPPSQKIKIPVFLYFHQPNFFDEINLTYKNLKFFLKRFFIQTFIKNVDYVFVQSEYVRNKILKKYRLNQEKIICLPFYEEINFKESDKNYQFFYPSIPYPHKNHENLIKAFILFYNQCSNGKLILTISKAHEKLYNKIKKLQKIGYPIVNVGEVNKSDIIKYYLESEYVVFPSLNESFGLGIVEGIMLNCKIIASDYDYVRAICKASLSFDPFSINSIQQALLKTSKSNQIKKSTLITENKVLKLIDLIF